MRVETIGTAKKYYLYSSDGIIGYEENGERFLYRKNLFGDITAIYKGATKVAEYQYDAWGNCTITLNTRNYGTNNPFRYRGYYWDNDLEMYYLMSRYYDPKTGRFINADTFDYLKPKAINGLNLYAYCRNNPVMYYDPMGYNPVAYLILLTYAAVAFAILGLYIAEYSSKKANENNCENVIDNSNASNKDNQLIDDGVGVWAVKAITDIIIFIINATLGIPSKESVEVVSGEYIGIDVSSSNDAYNYDKIDNPNWYVGLNQYPSTYFGLGGSIVGDPFLYTSFDDGFFGP